MRSKPATVDTHCPFCALNCGLSLEVKQGRVVDMTRWKGSPLTGGAVCSKGANAHTQVHLPERITAPLVRRGTDLAEVDWDEALDAAAEGFIRIRDRYGASGNAVLSGGSLTNEKAYLVGKLARLALGTPHIDLNGRMCMTAAGAANMRAFGADRAMTPLEHLSKTQAAMIIGANISSSYPVLIPQALEGIRRRGGRVIVVDPRVGRFARPGDLILQLKPATDAVLANGILRELVHRGFVDHAFVDFRTNGFTDAVAAAEPWTPEAVAGVTGVDADLIREAAAVLGRSHRAMYLHARGAEQQTSGTMNVLSYINIALARGHVGRTGCGINMLTGQRNGQGGREWGQRCDQLPAGRSIDNAEHRAEVAAHWGVDAEDLPARGLTYVEILEGAGRGDVKGLLSISTNMRISAPDNRRVPAQLGRLEHLVMIDPFLSESARQATVVLPGSTFAEEDGTITTIEGRVIRIERAIPPVAQRGDLDVIRNLGRRLGHRDAFDFHTGDEVFQEMRRVSAGAPIDYAGITKERLAAEGGVFWPCPTPDHPGTPMLYTEEFSHPDGKARFHAVIPESPPIQVDDEYPLILTTGRVLAHYLSGNQTMRMETQRSKVSEAVLEIHPETAAVVGLVPGAPARLVSRQGSVAVAWTPNPDLRRDTLFLPYHWEPANALTASALDPIAKIPGLKYTPVMLHPEPTAGSARDSTSEQAVSA